MEWVFKFGLMAQHMKVGGAIIRLMVRAVSSTATETCMRVCGIRIKLMGMDSMYTAMGRNMMELKTGPMARIMKGNTSMGKSMGKESLLGQMVILTWVISRTIICKVMEFIIG